MVNDPKGAVPSIEIFYSILLPKQQLTTANAHHRSQVQSADSIRALQSLFEYSASFTLGSTVRYRVRYETDHPGGCGRPLVF